MGYVTCRACGTNMNTTAVCGVCKGTFHAVGVLKWTLLRMYILTSEPSTKRLTPVSLISISVPV
jgi:hypothetical protein